MPLGGYWIKEEENILRELWNNKAVSLQEIARIMMRTTAAVKAKARSMDLGSREILEATWRVEEIKRRMQEVVEA